MEIDLRSHSPTIFIVKQYELHAKAPCYTCVPMFYFVYHTVELRVIQISTFENGAVNKTVTICIVIFVT